MDISTGLGLLAGACVLVTLILMGGDLRMFLDTHAFIVIESDRRERPEETRSQVGALFLWQAQRLLRNLINAHTVRR